MADKDLCPFSEPERTPEDGASTWLSGAQNALAQIANTSDSYTDITVSLDSDWSYLNYLTGYTVPTLPPERSTTYTPPKAVKSVEISTPTPYSDPGAPDFDYELDLTYVKPTPVTRVTITEPDPYAKPDDPTNREDKLVFTDPVAVSPIAIEKPTAYVAPADPSPRDTSYTTPRDPVIPEVTDPASYAAPNAPPTRDTGYTAPQGITTTEVTPPDPFTKPDDPTERDFSYTAPDQPVAAAVTSPTPYVAPPNPAAQDTTYTPPQGITQAAITKPAPYAKPVEPTERDYSYDEPVIPTAIAVTTPTYTAPAAPVSRDTSYTDPTAPAAISVSTPAPYVEPPIPTFDRELTIDTSGQPGAAPADDTGSAPAVTIPAFPVSPSYTTPAVPSINGITVPNLNPIQDIDTSVVVPTVDFPDITENLNFTNSQWTSTNLDDMRTHMSRVRNGDFAIGSEIWQQIYDRSGHQIYMDSVARERAGRRAHAKNGWSMPGITALAQQEQANGDVLMAAVTKALEVATQEALQKNDQFWQALERGTQIEGLYQTAHAQYTQRALEFAIAVQNASVAIYNALVARFNAQVQAAGLSIESKRLAIDEQRLILEDNRLKIEKAIAEGEADKIQLELYIAQWAGVKAAVDVYVAEVGAVKVNVDAQRAVLEAHGLNIEHYATKVNAWAKEWDGYESKMRGETAKAGVFDSYVRAHSADIEALRARIQGEGTRISSGVDIVNAQIANAKLALDRYQTEWQGVNTKMDSVTKLINSDIAYYEARVRGEDSRVNSLTEIEKIKQEAKSTEADIYRSTWNGISAKLDSVSKQTQADADIYGSKIQAESARLQGEVDYARIEQAIQELDVSRYTAEWGGISAKLDSAARIAAAEAQLYGAKVDGEEARLRSTLDVERIKQEASRVEADIYRAAWDGISAKLRAAADRTGADVSLYDSKVRAEAARLQGQVDYARIQQAIQEVDVRRFEAEWNAISAKLDSAARIIQSDVAYYSAQVDGERTRLTSEVDIERVKQERGRSDVQRLAAEWQGVDAKLGAAAQLTQADASLYNAKVQGEVGRLDSGARIAGLDVEVGRFDVERFRAEWQGIGEQLRAWSSIINSDVDLYRGKVEGENVRLTSSIALEQAKVDTMKADAQRFAAEWQGIGEKLKAMTAMVTAETDIYEAKVRGEIGRLDSETKIAQTKLTDLQADVARFAAEWDGISAQLTSAAQLTTADANLYRSKVDDARARVDFQVAATQAYRDHHDLNLRGNIEEVRIAVQQLSDKRKLAESSQIALGNIYAQLLAATYSSYSISSASSRSTSCSISDQTSFNINHNHDCETPAC